MAKKSTTGTETKAKSTRKKPVKKVVETEVEAPVMENAVENPLIHIVVRSHRRPKYFEKCIESIDKQVCCRKMIHVTADDAATETYVRKALDDGKIDALHVFNPNEIKKELADFTPFAKAGAKNSDKGKHFYDLYLNKVMEEIPGGWIFFVDDDTELKDELVLSNISEMLTDEDSVIIGQYEMKSRVLPDGEMWEKIPFTRAHVDMSCVVFHSKHKKTAKMDGHAAGDFRMANRLAKQLRPVWMKRIFVTGDNDGSFGKGEF